MPVANCLSTLTKGVRTWKARNKILWKITPYLVYSPDAEVSYTEGDSPTPPEPPTPVGSEGTFYLLELTEAGYHMTNTYILPIDATSLDDGEELDISEFDSATVSDGKITEIKAEAGKIIVFLTDSGEGEATLHMFFSDLLENHGGFITGSTDTAWIVMPGIKFDEFDIHADGLTIETIQTNLRAGTLHIPSGFWMGNY